MRAAVLREPGDVRVEVVELDPPHAGEVLVRVAVAGVCYSDAASPQHHFFRDEPC